MRKLSRITTTLLILVGLLSQHSTAYAQVLPRTTKSTKECFEFLRKESANLENKLKSTSIKQAEKDDILGCTIKTGQTELWMLPFFVTYLINFVLALAGLIATLFIVIGGYWYIIGSAQGQTDKGKNTILYAIIGLVVSLLAWIIVNIVQSAVT